MGFLQGVNSNEDEGSLEFSFAGLFKCMFCTHPKGNEEKVQLLHIASTLEKLEKKMEVVERYNYNKDLISLNKNCLLNIQYRHRTVDPHGMSRGRKLSVGHRGSTNGDHLDALAEGPENDSGSDSETDTLSTSPRVRLIIE